MKAMTHTTTRLRNATGTANQRAEQLAAAELETVTGGDGSLTGKPSTVAIVRPLSSVAGAFLRFDF
jgi:hypothetical protein